MTASSKDVFGLTGLGKTRLADVMARPIGGDYAMIAPNPDISPNDILGSEFWARSPNEETAKELWFNATCTPAQLVTLSLKLTKGWTEKHPAPMPGLVYQANASKGDRWRTLPDGSFTDSCGPLPAHEVGFEGSEPEYIDGTPAERLIGRLSQGQWLGFEQYPDIGFAWLSRRGSLLHALPVVEDDELVGYRLQCNPAPGMETCEYMRVAEKLGIVWTP